MLHKRMSHLKKYQFLTLDIFLYRSKMYVKVIEYNQNKIQGSGKKHILKLTEMSF